MADIFHEILRGERSPAGHSDYLADLAARFPYFGPAQFLYLRSLEKDDPRYASAAAKTALHFRELFYLNHRLEEKIPAVDEAPVVVAETTDDTAPAAIQPMAIVLPDESAVVESLPLFEPLHATDYFASQGIKLSEDALGGDQLATRLKSFTAWLKTMKKINPEVSPTAGSEVVMQSLAEKSNQAAEVLTEAMAEAFEQQGKKEKAIEIYRKLSLQNPSKNAYFAAKIYALK